MISMNTSLQKDLPDKLITSNKYIVQLAETEKEIRKAQSLRYRVFNIELGEGLDQSHKTQLDVDKYDKQCDHLLVIERDSEEVIGTYRIQRYELAQKNHGFYTEDEFDLSVLADDILDRSVEVGRACIHKDHRNGRVLYLLWRGIGEYMKLTSSRYLFGCCSITNVVPRAGWITMDYLCQKGYVHDKYRIDTKPEFHCPETERDKEAWQEIKLPQLFRLYLDLGAKVLSGPALDKAFKTIDYLILLDINELDERSKTLFFK